MAERIIRCPGCQSKFKLRASGAGNVRCPSCRQVIRVGTPEESPDADDLFSRLMDDDDLADRPPKKRPPAPSRPTSSPTETYSLTRMPLPAEEPAPLPLDKPAARPTGGKKRRRSRTISSYSSSSSENSYLASGLKLIVILAVVIGGAAWGWEQYQAHWNAGSTVTTASTASPAPASTPAPGTYLPATSPPGHAPNTPHSHPAPAPYGSAQQQMEGQQQRFQDGTPGPGEPFRNRPFGGPPGSFPGPRGPGPFGPGGPRPSGPSTLSDQFAESQILTLHIEGGEFGAHNAPVTRHLQSLLGSGSTRGSASGQNWTIQLAPVNDVQKFLDRIAIGTVSNVSGREATLTLDLTRLSQGTPRPGRAGSRRPPAGSRSTSQSPIEAPSSDADESPFRSKEPEGNAPHSSEPQPSTEESPFRQKDAEDESPFRQKDS